MRATLVRDVLHLGQHVRREEDGAAAGRDLLDELVERLLDERVEPARRLVEHEQVGIMEERLHEPHLLTVPPRELLDPPFEIEIEPARELFPSREVVRAAEMGEEAEQLAAGHPLV